MTLGIQKNTGNWKRKHSIALCGELALECISEHPTVGKHKLNSK
jgi:hypothetical protein